MTRRLPLVAALLAIPAAVASAGANPPSLGETRRAAETCARRVVAEAQTRGHVLDADAVRMQPQIGGGSGRNVEFTFRVETPDFAARGDCLAVGRGGNYRVGRFSLRVAD